MSASIPPLHAHAPVPAMDAVSKSPAQQANDGHNGPNTRRTMVDSPNSDNVKSANPYKQVNSSVFIAKSVMLDWHDTRGCEVLVLMARSETEPSGDSRRVIITEAELRQFVHAADVRLSKIKRHGMRDLFPQLEVCVTAEGMYYRVDTWRALPMSAKHVRGLHIRDLHDLGADLSIGRQQRKDIIQGHVNLSGDWWTVAAVTMTCASPYNHTRDNDYVAQEDKSVDQ